MDEGNEHAVVNSPIDHVNQEPWSEQFIIEKVVSELKTDKD